MLPLLYVDFAALHDDEPEDDLVSLVRSFQWSDWTELRFSERESGDYRRGVTQLAERLVEANRAADAVDAVAAAETLEDESGEGGVNELGILDKIAASEDAMPKWSQTLERIGDEITQIGGAMERATVDLQRSDSRGKGFAGRLRVARELANDIAEPSSAIAGLGNDFATQLHTVDVGIRALIEQASAEAQADPSARHDVCEFFEVVRQLAHASDEGLGLLRGMIDAIAPVEGMSRDLRRPLRAMRQGLTLMLEGREVAAEWVKLIEASPVECSSGESCE